MMEYSGRDVRTYRSHTTTSFYMKPIYFLYHSYSWQKLVSPAAWISRAIHFQGYPIGHPHVSRDFQKSYHCFDFFQLQSHCGNKNCFKGSLNIVVLICTGNSWLVGCLDLFNTCLTSVLLIENIALLFWRFTLGDTWCVLFYLFLQQVENYGNGREPYQQHSRTRPTGLRRKLLWKKLIQVVGMSTKC